MFCPLIDIMSMGRASGGLRWRENEKKRRKRAERDGRQRREGRGNVRVI